MGDGIVRYVGLLKLPSSTGCLYKGLGHQAFLSSWFAIWSSGASSIQHEVLTRTELMLVPHPSGSPTTSERNSLPWRTSQPNPLFFPLSFETGSRYLALVVLKLTQTRLVLNSESNPTCWDWRHIPSWLAAFGFNNRKYTGSGVTVQETFFVCFVSFLEPEFQYVVQTGFKLIFINMIAS